MEIDKEEIIQLLENGQTEEIVRIGKPAVPELIKALTGTRHTTGFIAKNDMRSRAARVLGEIGDRQAVPALIDVIEDNHEWTALLSIEALGKIKDARAAPALIQGLRSDKRFSRHYTDMGGNTLAQYFYAGEALEMIGQAAVPALINGLADEDWMVREKVADMLVRNSGTWAIDLRDLQASLNGFVDRARKTDDAQQIDMAKIEASEIYQKIADAVRKSRSKITIGNDGELLKGERLKPPRGSNDNGMFRGAGVRRIGVC